MVSLAYSELLNQAIAISLFPVSLDSWRVDKEFCSSFSRLHSQYYMPYLFLFISNNLLLTHSVLAYLRDSIILGTSTVRNL